MHTLFARNILTTVFGLMFALCAAAEDPSALHRYSLENGLRVWNLERDSSDSVAVCLSVPVGWRNETEDRNGITHFVEHMVFAGSERYDRTMLMEMIFKRGGMDNAFTKDERTLFCGQIAAEHFELLMDWLSQVVFHPTFPPEQVDAERNIILDEIGGKKGWLREFVEAVGQSADVDRELRKGLFPGSNLAMGPAGDHKTLNSIKHADLLDYYHTHYMPNNAVLVVAGNVSPDRVERVCREYFGSLKPGTRPQVCATLDPTNEPPGTKTLRVATFTKQCTLLMGIRTCSEKDPDRWPLLILAELLDQSLMTEGRYKRALAYSIDADNVFFSDTGYFQLSTSCKRGNLAPLRKLMEEQIDRVRKGEIDPAALTEAKDGLNGRWSLSLETNWNQTQWLASLARLYDDKEPLPIRNALVNAVTAEDLARVVNLYFVPERTCVTQNIPLI